MIKPSPALGHDLSASDSALYLAYGSNLHPLRLQARLPSSRLIAVTRISGLQLSFDKCGQDGSGKANLTPAAEQTCSYGALYQIERCDITELDRIEGGYRRCDLDVELTDPAAAGGTVHHRAFSYLAQPELIEPSLQPFDWYHALVIAGAQLLEFATDYQQQLQRCNCQSDSNPERAEIQHQLLQRLQHSSVAGLTIPTRNAWVNQWHKSSD